MRIFAILKNDNSTTYITVYTLLIITLFLTYTDAYSTLHDTSKHSSNIVLFLVTNSLRHMHTLQKTKLPFVAFHAL